MKQMVKCITRNATSFFLSFFLGQLVERCEGCCGHVVSFVEKRTGAGREFLG